MSLFADRRAAGRQLAQAVAARLGGAAAAARGGPVVVLALPRGGVPVAAEVARALHAPLDVLLVRKIGAPWQPELAVGALAEGAAGEPPELVLDDAACSLTGADPDYLARRAQQEAQELARRAGVYRPGRAPLPVAGATVVLVDDGIATGTTVRAALQALARQQPARVVLAVPVAPASTLALLAGACDDIVVLSEPPAMASVGEHYRDFRQVSDDEVLAALQER